MRAHCAGTLTPKLQTLGNKVQQLLEGVKELAVRP